jgi:hypothetical protein
VHWAAIHHVSYHVLYTVVCMIPGGWVHSSLQDVLEQRLGVPKAAVARCAGAAHCEGAVGRRTCAWCMLYPVLYTVAPTHGTGCSTPQLPQGNPRLRCTLTGQVSQRGACASASTRARSAARAVAHWRFHVAKAVAALLGPMTPPPPPHQQQCQPHEAPQSRCISRRSTPCAFRSSME